ncbi:MAG: site-2 protease family protein [Chloroflexi bacterium]|nr:MAG: site-2 protease family protein [Chloroflexota bacterium]
MPDSESTTPSGEPPVYTWQPGGPQPQWLPVPPQPRPTYQHDAQWPPPPRTQGLRRSGGGIAGAIAAGAAAFFKYGLVLLKVGKLGPTLISMVIAPFFYMVFFGPVFAIGVVLLILVHEMGHVIVSRLEGVPMSLPVFLGPFGAFTRMQQAPRDARQEAVIAIGGPVFGTAAAFACFLWAEAVAPGTLHYLLLALAYFGCFINLFNLIPMSPLDGGRVANAISPWMNVVGLVIMGAVVLFLGNPFALIIFILGLITTVQRFRNARRGLEPAAVPPSTRLRIGAAWVTMLLVTAGGMSITHSAIVDSNSVPGVTQSA